MLVGTGILVLGSRQASESGGTGEASGQGTGRLRSQGGWEGAGRLRS